MTQPQVGDIWISGNGWHILLLKKVEMPNNRQIFFSLYLEDGVKTNVEIDAMWHKVA